MKRGRKRRWRWLLLPLLVLLLLPTILSTGPARRLLLEQATGRLPGQLKVETWSFAWWGGQSVKGLSYEDKQAGIRVAVDQLTLDRGLFGLALNHRSLGSLAVDGVDLYVTAGTASPPSALASTPGGGSRSAKTVAPSAAPTAARPFIWPQVSGEVTVKRARLFVEQEGADPLPVIDDLNLRANAAPEQPVNLALNVAFAGNGGALHSRLQVGPPPADPVDPADLPLEGQFDIQDWDLGRTFSSLAGFAGLPTGRGTVGASLHIEGKASDALSVRGDLMGRGLAFAGGPFGEDTPDIGDVAVRVVAKLSGQRLDPLQLTVQSGLFTAETSGHYDRDQASQIQGRVKLDLAKLATALPHTLGLDKGLTVTDGLVNMGFSLTGEAPDLALSAQAALDHLTGTMDGQPIAWSEPVAVHLQGSYAGGMAEVKDLRITSSFLKASARGRMEDFSLEASMDVGAALDQVGQFVDVAGWEGQGTATLHLDTRPATSGGVDGEGVLKLDALTITQEGRAVVTDGQAVLNIDGGLDPVPGPKGPVVLRSPRLTWDSWLGSGRASVERVSWSPGHGEWNMANAAVKANARLAEWSALLAGLNKLGEATQLDGVARLNASLDLAGPALTLHAGEIQVTDLRVVDGGKSLHDELLRLTASGEADLEHHHLSMPQVGVEFSAGRLVFTGVQLADWTETTGPVDAVGVGELDLAKLQAVLGDFTGMDPDLRLAGQARVNLAVKSPPGVKRTAELNAKLTKLVIRSGDYPPIEEKQADLAASLSYAADEERTDLTSCRLDSSPLSLRASGVLTGDDQHGKLELSGTVRPDLAVLATYLNTLLHTEVEMAGQAEKPFRVLTSWTRGQDDMLKNLDLEAAFHADRLAGFGLVVEDLDVPLRAVDQRATLTLDARVNQGALHLIPTVLYDEAPVLVLPDDTVVLDNLELTDELANGLLSLIHPLFHQPSALEGRMGLVLNSFYWPLDAQRRDEARFAGRLYFKDVTLAASGVIEKVLNAARIKERSTHIGDRTVDFVGEHGRVTCSPLKVQAGGHGLRLAGSIGFDQSLDYRVELPLTADLLPRELAPYVQGSTLTLPVGGTISRPRLDDRALQRALADLTRQAAARALQDKAGGRLREEAGKALQKLLK